MALLSRSVDGLDAEYDVVIVGSGYGAAICAARVAMAGRRVCVLERGREVRPGGFPETAPGLAAEVQLRTDTHRWGRRTALMDVRAAAGASVVVGCGLGGTSLINAGVLMRPPDRIFADDRWPAALRGDGLATLTPYLDRAEWMLGAQEYPRGWPALSKVEVLESIAAAVGGRVERPMLAVSFRTGPNHAGVEQTACRLCGNCVTGCNYGAKGAVTANYLPLAAAHGAEIYTGVEVGTVLRGADGRWVVAFRAAAGPSSFVRAGVVILAAGALGSTEILFRSRSAGLAVSSRLGEGFTGNGGGLAFAYAGNRRVAGWGRRRAALDADTADAAATAAVGPAIAGVVRVGGDLVEEGVVPSGLAVATAAALALRSRDTSVPRVEASLRHLRRVATFAHREPAGRTLTLLLTGDEPEAGRLDWAPGAVGVRVRGGVGDVRRHDLTAVVGATGGRLVTGPFGSPTERLTVHPLGGCVMADDGATGVVDDRGRIFDGAGDTVHDGLYVVDGATVPRALTVNPALTIAALAERAAEALVRERGWSPADAANALADAANARVEAANAPTNLRFTEHLRGHLGRNRDGDPRAGAEQGRADGTPLHCVLTLATARPPATVDNLGLPWTVTGTVVAPALSPRRLRVAAGTFRAVDSVLPGTRGFRARYELRLLSDDGERFTLTGTKEIHAPRALSPLALWRESTTLSAVVHREPTGEVVAAGVASISMPDLARQLASVRMSLPVLAARVTPPRRAVAPLGRHRALRLPPPEPRWCAGDGRWHAGDRIGPDAWLRLIRYRGGDRGPVMLAAGFSMSATSFLVDTVSTNLVEHLAGEGFDVWLFDYRAGIDLPSARADFTMDDIATRDWPAAVAEVRRVSGAETVQALGHCVGSATLMMALAAGLGGVRSAICMQTTLHPVASTLNVAKATLPVSRLVRALGGRRVSPPRGGSVAAVVAGALYRAVPAPPHERCGKAICGWINALYGSTHRHAQLNDATHEALDDLFDVGNVAALEHLGRIVRGRAAIDASGADRYLRHPERLKLPLLLVQGECNDIFRPEGSLRTLEWLVAANGPERYERVVLPGYAHLDALIGENAARDVYPLLAAHLARFDRTVAG